MSDEYYNIYVRRPGGTWQRDQVKLTFEVALERLEWSRIATTR